MSSSASNQEYTVAQRPQGLPDDKTFKLEPKDMPKAPDGQITVKALFISVDPYLRGVLGHTPVPGPFTSGQVAEVVESKSGDYKAGDRVFFYGHWARFQTVDPASKDARLQKTRATTTCPPTWVCWACRAPLPTSASRTPPRSRRATSCW
jgi:NADPH-dependent curcumin reductase CurA